MSYSELLLPAFDAHHIESYFFNDYDAIKEIFKVTNDNLGDDLTQLPKAFEDNNIILLQDMLHTLRPIFNFVGLPAIEQEISNLYDNSIKATSANDMKTEFDMLWPKLLNAQKLIARQHHLFEMQTRLIV